MDTDTFYTGSDDGMEQTGGYQKQINWLNLNLRREIQERLQEGVRVSRTIYYLDQRILKLEKIKYLFDKRESHYKVAMWGTMSSILLLIINTSVMYIYSSRYV